MVGEIALPALSHISFPWMTIQRKEGADLALPFGPALNNHVILLINPTTC
jgi:hypothetical protein